MSSLDGAGHEPQTWVSGAPPPGAASYPASADPLIGRLLAGRYRIVTRVAKGGMGRVYRAVQEPLGRTVAIKVLEPFGMAHAPDDFHRRFLLEASIAARLNHPHVVTIFDHGRDTSGVYFIAMEFLQGETLAQLMAREGPLPPQRALRLAAQVAWAVTHAHSQGAIHRDLKPANIFVQQLGGQMALGSGDDFVKVVDFGLVKQFGATDDDLTETGQFLGSPGYMAPEQIRGEAVDGRCDIYALGAMLYEMLAGAPPFERGSPLETMVAHVHEPLPPLMTLLTRNHRPAPWQADVVALVEHALRKDPEARVGTMAAFHESLMAALERLCGQGGPRPATSAGKLCSMQPLAVLQGEGHAWAEVSVQHVFAPGGLGASGRALPDGAPPAALATAPAAPTAMHPYYGVGMRPRPAEHTKPSAKPAALGMAPKPWHRRWRRRAALVTALLVAALGLPAAGAWWARATRPILLTMTSSPVGASVRLGGQVLCAQTPCQVSYVPKLWQRHVSLHFSHPGLEAYVTTRRLDGSHLIVRCALDHRAKDGHEHLDEDQADDGHLDAHGLL